ncbi:MAG: 30S ribosomal protein S6 [Bacteroidetes bacterium]|nr:30S ribosomal protein S6 [Bacteroidota bacterium]
MYHYETVFILTPVLSEEQAKEAVGKFRKSVKDLSATIVHEESWGLRKLAYQIQKKSTGHYHLFEYTAKDGNALAELEVTFKRDERVLRFLSVKLDKNGTAYAEKRRAKAKAKKDAAKAAEKKETAN